MKLTDLAIKTTKGSEKPYKLFDGKGLYLLVNPGSSRWWRFKYRYGGRRAALPRRSCDLPVISYLEVRPF
jgi:hypothetical protein